MELNMLKKRMSEIKEVRTKEEVDAQMLEVAERYTGVMDSKPLPFGISQCIMAIEELSELQKELTKYIRKGGDVSDKTPLIEEIGDVEHVLVSLKYILNLKDEDILRSRMVKLDHFEKVFEGNRIIQTLKECF